MTTAAGLVIGITAVIFYSIFRGRVQKYIAELEAAATHLMALLAAQYNRRRGSAPQPIYAEADEYGERDEYSERDRREGSDGRPFNDRPDTHGM